MAVAIDHKAARGVVEQFAQALPFVMKAIVGMIVIFVSAIRACDRGG
ncbi:MAG: hypothetical protein WCS43_18755 [Verrucomicrobiota bacterium]